MTDTELDALTVAAALARTAHVLTPRPRRASFPPASQLAKVSRLVDVARLEIAGMLEGDHVLRRLILADLDALIRNVRGTSVQVARKWLPDLKE